MQSDQAAVENAQATLAYTTITAPIDGRTGIRMVDEGNIVRASDADSAIVVITQIKPISVLFNLPQQDLARVNDAFAKGPLAVDAQRSDNNAVIDRGTLTRGRQPGRSSRPARSSSRPNFPTPICSSGRASSSMCGC